MGKAKPDILSGTLAFMILKTIDAMGPLHGYAIARRIEQISGGELELNQGSLYPALLRLEQEDWIAPKWGDSDTGRRVKFYSITRAGKKQLHAEQADWQRTSAILARFTALTVKA